MVDWDRYRGGFGGGWAVSWFVNAMQGQCNVNPIFCLLGDFVLLLISSFEFSGHSLRNVNYNLFVLTYLNAARLDLGLCDAQKLNANRNGVSPNP